MNVTINNEAGHNDAVWLNMLTGKQRTRNYSAVNVGKQTNND